MEENQKPTYSTTQENKPLQAPPPPPDNLNIGPKTSYPTPRFMSKRMAIIFLAIIVIIFLISGGAYFLGKNSSGQQVACTQEAKICPDGSAVGRTGPNCEFAACPTTTSSSSAETANWKTFIGKGFSYTYPSEIFIAEKNVCDNASNESTALLEKSSNNKYLCGLAPYVFNVKKVDKKDINVNDSCFLITKKPILIDNEDGEEYTVKFIGGDKSECTKGITGLYSNEKKLIYVTKNNQLYLIEWHVLDIEQLVYDQILSTFKFTQ